MKHCFVFILFLLTINLFSQTPPETLWTQTYGGSGDDRSYSVQQTTDGGYIIAGCTTSYGSEVYDFWLVKTDENGNEDWTQTYQGTDWDMAYSVQQTTDGGYIVAGYTGIFGTGDMDFWLVKTDENGNEDWNKTYGGPANDRAYSVQQTSDGGYIIAGHSESYGSEYYDFWLIKTDENGDEDWNQTYDGGSSSDGASSVQQTTDGGYIVAGWTDSNGAGSRDFWLVKTDENGNENWNQTFGGPIDDYATSVQQTTDGGYIIAGWTDSYGAGGRDFWLVKTDENGNENWNQTYGGSYHDYATSVQQTTDGGYIAAGYTGSYGAGSDDFWLIKTDENGTENWNQTYGGSDGDGATSVQQTTDGGYIVAGDTWTYATFSSDFRLIRLSEDTDSGDDIISNDPIQLSNYPNPFNPETVITFQLPSSSNQQNMTLVIYNINGQKIKDLTSDIILSPQPQLGKGTSGSYNAIWNGTDDNGNIIGSGVYFYKLRSGKYISTKKMILMK